MCMEKYINIFVFKCTYMRVCIQRLYLLIQRLSADRLFSVVSLTHAISSSYFDQVVEKLNQTQSKIVRSGLYMHHTFIYIYAYVREHLSIEAHFDWSIARFYYPYIARIGSHAARLPTNNVITHTHTLVHTCTHSHVIKIE